MNFNNMDNRGEEMMGGYCHWCGNKLPCENEKCRKETERSNARTEEIRRVLSEYREIFNAENKRTTKHGENVAFIEGRSILWQEIMLKKMADIILPRITSWFNDRKKLICSQYGIDLASSHDPYGMSTETRDSKTHITYNEIVVKAGEIGDPRGIAEILLHEIGHAVEKKLEFIARQEGLSLCDDEHRWANLIAARILYPETLDTYTQSDKSKLRDTIKCIEILCKTIDTGGIKKQIDDLIQSTYEEMRLEIERSLQKHPEDREFVFPDFLKEGHNRQSSLLESLYNLCDEVGEKYER